MQKIILDTNVLVSALVQRSYPFLIVDNLFATNEFELCISEALLREYYEVLNRRKFSKYHDFLANAETLLINIERKGKLYTPGITLSIINDFADNRLLELADESKADFLITGNTNDFTISSYKHTQIVNPKDYFQNHHSGLI